MGEVSTPQCWLRSGCFPPSRAFEPALGPLLTAVLAPVLAGKGLLLFFRTENLAPLSALQDKLITTLKDLKGCVDLIHLVELHRTGLAKIFEVRRVGQSRSSESR